MSAMAVGQAAPTGVHKHGDGRRAARDAGDADFGDAVRGDRQKTRDAASTGDVSAAHEAEPDLGTAETRTTKTIDAGETETGSDVSDPVDREQRRKRRADDELAGFSADLPPSHIVISERRRKPEHVEDSTGDRTVAPGSEREERLATGSEEPKVASRQGTDNPTTGSDGSPLAASVTPADSSPKPAPTANRNDVASTSSTPNDPARSAPIGADIPAGNRPVRQDNTTLAPTPSRESAPEVQVTATNEAPGAPLAAEARTQTPPVRTASFQAELTVAAANYSIPSGKLAPSFSGRQADSRPAVSIAERSLANPVRFAAQQHDASFLAPAADRAGMDAIGEQSAVADRAQRTERVSDVDAAGEMESDASRDGPRSAQAATSATALANAATPVSTPTASAVVAAIASEPTWRPATVAATTHFDRLQSARSATDLSIQLHPAELGMVTATLKLSGTQLSVELAAENSEAQSRLESDRDTILKALRALGFDVDQVTIQPVVTNSTPARTDATTTPTMPAARDQDATGANSSGGGGRSGSQQSGRDEHETTRLAPTNAPGGSDRGRGGVYI